MRRKNVISSGGSDIIEVQWSPLQWLLLLYVQCVVLSQVAVVASLMTSRLPELLPFPVLCFSPINFPPQRQCDIYSRN